MKASLSNALILCAAVGLASPAYPKPAKYEIDPEHFAVGFLVHHVGYSKVLGMFRKAAGTYVFDEETGALSSVKIVVDTASVFTNYQKRDDHLKSADFLNATEFPKMTFTADGARRTGDRTFVIEGRLELLGRTNPMTLEATWNKSAEYAFSTSLFGGKQYRMGVSARGSFKRSAFGMKYGVDNGWVGDDVELIIEFEARRE
ncbi:MAG TPA: YceI family protein [Burkholderiales bacterium]|nr:YceI family protein [Burkholderiales bacterium]